MKKFIPVVVAFLLGAVSSVAVASLAVPTVFPDVDYDAYYGDAVSSLSGRHIIEGDSYGNYNPSAPVTRADLAVILDRYDDLLLSEEYPSGLQYLKKIVCQGVDKGDMNTSTHEYYYEEVCEANVLLNAD